MRRDFPRAAHSTSRGRAKPLVTPWGLFVLAFVAAFEPACGGHSSATSAHDGGTLPEICEQYLGVYAACMHRLLPQSAAIADARSANARASLEQLIDHEDQLRDTCASGATRLQASCQ